MVEFLPLIVAIVGSFAAPRQSPTLKLVVVQRYGWEDVNEAHRRLTPKEVKLGGGMLGSVGTFAIGPDHRLYVPDGDMHKVVVFNADGSVFSVWGGNGDGPGELRVPFDIAIGGDGIVYVYDMRTKQINSFRPDGKFQRRFAFPGDLISNIVWANGALAAARWVPDGAKAMISLNAKTGAVSDSSLAFSKLESQLYKYGSGPMVFARGTTTAVASPVPGKWYALPSRQTFGGARYPDARVYTRTIGSMPGVRATTDRLNAFGIRKDGSAVFVYTHRTKLAERRGELVEDKTYLEIVWPDGRTGGRHEFEPDQHVYGLALDGEDVLLGVTDETPQVWRVRISQK